jgi:DNA replication protein DnaC
MADPLHFAPPKTLRQDAAEQPPCDCGGEEKLRLLPRGGRVVAQPCSCTAGCALCAGSGRVYDKDERGYSVVRGCSCGADPRRIALVNGLQLPAKFADKRLRDYKHDHNAQIRAWRRADRFVQEFVPGAQGIRALVLCGPPGTGKTHLLCGILRELALQKGVRGRYEEFFLLLSDIRDGFSRGLSSREWLAPLRSVDVLAIDELGKGGRNVEFEQGVLDEIISVRYNAGKPTLFATNYRRPGVTWPTGAEQDKAETLDQRVGQRIYSRLHELCDFIDVLGNDHRKEEHDDRQQAGGAQQQARPEPAPANAVRPAARSSSR